MRTLTFTTIFLLVAVFTQTAETVSQENVKTNVVTELKNSAGVQDVSKDNTTQNSSMTSPESTRTNQQNPVVENMTLAWNLTWERFYHPRTSLFYDYLSSYEKGKELSHLPTAEEVKRQYPNRYGYFTGMEDGMILGGTMLCTVIDRYEVTHEDHLKESAAKVYLGLKHCATQHGIPGFIARNFCVEDGTSFYHSSSRDQYTHCIHGLWRYYRSALSDEAAKTEIRKIFSEVADRMQRNVTPKNNFNALNADNKEDPLMRMWNTMPHEAARLPMIYAAAWDVTGDDRYYKLYRQYLADAIEQSKKMGTYQMMSVIIVQAQASFELLYQLETDPVLKEELKKLKHTTSTRCLQMASDQMEKIRQMDAEKRAILPPNWRNVPMNSESYPQLGEFRKVNTLLREIGASLLVVFMSDAPEQREEARKLVEEMALSMDYQRFSSSGIIFHLAAYWKENNRLNDAQ
ncbi:MAG: hypothetical protein LBC48_08830 [Dysgonamonadaceae bacterium]|nr:hypothetical protein [Dysgonamonadaceae bacterium]